MVTLIPKAPGKSAELEKELIIRAEAQITEAQAYQITDRDSADSALFVTKQIRNAIKQVEDFRKSLVKPLNDHVTSINDRFKPIVERLKVAQNEIDGKILAFKAREDELRKREEEAMLARKQDVLLEQAKHAETAGAGEIAKAYAEEALNLEDAKVPAAFAMHSQFGQTASTRKIWQYEIVDISKVPRTFFMLDNAAVMDAIRDQAKEGLTPYIPGLAITQRELLSVR